MASKKTEKTKKVRKSCNFNAFGHNSSFSVDLKLKGQVSLIFSQQPNYKLIEKEKNRNSSDTEEEDI